LFLGFDVRSNLAKLLAQLIDSVFEGVETFVVVRAEFHDRTEGRQHGGKGANDFEDYVPHRHGALVTRESTVLARIARSLTDLIGGQWLEIVMNLPGEGFRRDYLLGKRVKGDFGEGCISEN